MWRGAVCMFGGGDQNFLGLHEWGTIFFSRGGVRIFLYSLYSVTKKIQTCSKFFKLQTMAVPLQLSQKGGHIFFESWTGIFSYNTRHMCLSITSMMTHDGLPDVEAITAGLPNQSSYLYTYFIWICTFTCTQITIRCGKKRHVLHSSQK